MFLQSRFSNKTSFRMKKVFETKWTMQSLIALILVTVVACSTVPLTGRRQLSLVPESDMMALSFTEYDKFIKTNKLSTDKNNAAMVKRCLLYTSPSPRD